MRKLITVGLLLATLSTMANDKIVASERPVTITAQDKMVEVSVLNTGSNHYTLNILNARGETVHTEVLGSEKSLGRLFDFSDAPRTTYTFEFTGSNGERFTHSVRTGSWK